MGKKINVIVELSPQQDNVLGITGDEPQGLPLVDGIKWDHRYGKQAVPTAPGDALLMGITGAEEEMLIARGQVDEDDLENLLAAVEASPHTRAVHSDPVIEGIITCGNTPAVGNAADVAKLLNEKGLAQAGMTGKDVAVAVVDTGIDVAFLKTRVSNVNFDASRSFSSSSSVKPGQVKRNHGTMCAFDVKIGAPDATLIDVAVLRPLTLNNLLSDAILAYRHLLDLIQKKNLFGTFKALVVTNSWGVFDPSTDIPLGSYTDTPTHPFTVIVGSLARAGADVLFAAGNCGPQCPDIRCRPSGKPGTIYGANSSPDVCCVAGVDIHKQRVGYSSTGPGRLSAQKPDLAGYTHFAGSGVEPVDSGTSAATPVVAGFFAAARSKFPASSTSPSAFRQMMIAGLDHGGSAAHDLGIGFGIVDGTKFLAQIGGGTTTVQPGAGPAAVQPSSDEQGIRDVS